jgi:signal transduction histidine kinase
MHDLLLVAPDADHLARTCAPGPCRITPASGLPTARALLSGHRYACVVVSAGEDGWLDEIRDLVGRLGGGTEVIALEGSDPAHLSGLLRELASAENGALPPEPTAPASAPRPGSTDALLGSLRDDMAHVVHALNNPLAVISGNAQLGAEIARSLAADASIVEAFVEIEAAAQQLGGLFADVTRLRLRIEDALREGGGEG